MSPIDRERLQVLLYGERGQQRRFTQDSPVSPEVWFAFGDKPSEPQDLLLTPHAPHSAGELARALRKRLKGIGSRLAYTNTYVVAELTFEELVEAALPLSLWWRRLHDNEEATGWFSALVEAIAGDLEVADAEPASDEPLLWWVSQNRPARPALARSTRTVKADAARRLFLPSCRNLRWAVLDSGVDATHPAFLCRGDDPPRSRVVATYDFTRIREVMSEPGELKELERRLVRGQAVDWELIGKALQIPHGEKYEPPVDEHGTHVAGILAGDWQASDPDMPYVSDLVGMCPDLELYDMRILGGDGGGTEFSILGALQFIRDLNARSDLQVIHGVNLSISIDHDVENYACGRTPICEEVERLIGAGVVVVAAAGNEGWSRYFDRRGNPNDGYRSLSITDPGNAQGAITVGSTHAGEPHSYGVSYFSSRGPTGDGRLKPDLVAPGEKITAPVPGASYRSKDGTSMAAPHVSGAAALLMARHEELRGQPAVVKQVLMETATDLGRERYFQGAGLLDVLRAMQRR